MPGGEGGRPGVGDGSGMGPEMARPRRPGARSPRGDRRKPPSAASRRKAPLWTKLAIAFGAVVMVGSLAAVAVPAALARWATSNIEDSEFIPPEFEATDISGPINFLLLGIDERKEGIMATEPIRADSIVLVNIPASHDVIYMISFPRDLRVEIPASEETNYSGAWDKIAHAFAFGAMTPDWVRDPSKEGRERGVGLTIRTISNMVPGGLRFNGAAIIDFDGFDAVVEALGSVYMCVDTDVYSIHYWADGGKAGNPLWGGLSDEPADGQYGQGYHYEKDWCGEMEPWQALDYSRQRYGMPNTDYDRQRHQQQLLKAIVKKIASPDTFTNLRTILDLQEAAGDLLTLDLNDTRIEDWVLTLSGLRAEDIVMVQTYGGTYRTENVDVNGQLISYQRLDQDLVELLESVKNDTVRDFLIRHSDWVAPNA